MLSELLTACVALTADSSAMSRALHAPWTPEGVTAVDTVAVSGATDETPLLLRLSYDGDDGTPADIYVCAGRALPLPLAHDFDAAPIAVRDLKGEDVAVDFGFCRSELTAITDHSRRPQLQFTQTVTMQADGQAFVLSSVYYEYLVNADSTMTMMSARPLVSDMAEVLARYRFVDMTPDRLLKSLMPPRAATQAVVRPVLCGTQNDD